MFVRIIKSYRDVVAVCDSELLGKRFEEDQLQLDVKENFYKGKETSPKQTIRIMQDMFKEDATFNIVGEESTQTAIEAGIIAEENIGRIQGIPFAFILI